MNGQRRWGVNGYTDCPSRVTLVAPVEGRPLCAAAACTKRGNALCARSARGRSGKARPPTSSSQVGRRAVEKNIARGLLGPTDNTLSYRVAAPSARLAAAGCIKTSLGKGGGQPFAHLAVSSRAVGNRGPLSDKPEHRL